MSWKPATWSEMSRAERKAYRDAHADEIAEARKAKRQGIRRLLAKAILEAAEAGDALSGDEKFDMAAELALRGLDEILAFDKLRGDASMVGAVGEKITDWLVYQSPLRAWVEGEIQALYELGFDELRKLAGEG